MARGVRKHGWRLRTRAEGSKVVDRRRGTGNEVDEKLENTTLAKISRYHFDRPVIFKGFDDEPVEVSGRRKAENQNCVSNEHNNVVLVGKRNIFWFLRKKEKK